VKREFVVGSIGIDEQGLEIQYLILPDDVRSQGHVTVSRSVSVSFQGPDGLGAAATDLNNAAVELAAKVHDLLDSLPVYEPPAVERMALPFPEDDDDDEDVGMGDGR
jgi:hypothetical protein